MYNTICPHTICPIWLQAGHFELDRAFLVLFIFRCRLWIWLISRELNFVILVKSKPLNWRKIGVRQIGDGCGGRKEGGSCRISAAVGQKGGWKIFKFNSSFMRIRHSWSNLNIWRFNGKRPIKKVTESAHFWVKHQHTKNTVVCGLSESRRMHCELLLLHKSFWLNEIFVLILEP